MTQVSPSPYPLGPEPTVSAAERSFATYLHLSLYSTVFLNIFGLVIPLVMWIHRKDGSRFIDSHGKAVLNLAATIVVLAFILVLFILAPVIAFNMRFILDLFSSNEMRLPLAPVFLILGLAAIGISLSLALFIVPIIGINAANSGKEFRYPFTFRFIR